MKNLLEKALNKKDFILEDFIAEEANFYKEIFKEVICPEFHLALDQLARNPTKKHIQ
jgi:hypothetical protein